MRWYVLQVSSGQEKAVRDAMHEKRIPALVPSENRRVRKGGEWTQKEYILFPGYVFLRLDYTSETYYRVRSIPHAGRLLGPPGDPPVPLSYLEAEWIGLLSGGGKPLEPAKAAKLPDGSLQIESGVPKSFPAHAVSYDTRARRVKLELTICGEPKTITLSFILTDRNPEDQVG